MIHCPGPTPLALHLRPDAPSPFGFAVPNEIGHSPQGVRGESARGRKSVAKVAKSREMNSKVERPKNPSGNGGFLRRCVALKLVARGRIELPTYGFSDRRSSD
jgi:hypothetical protein